MALEWKARSQRGLLSVPLKWRAGRLHCKWVAASLAVGQRRLTPAAPSGGPTVLRRVGTQGVHAIAFTPGLKSGRRFAAKPELGLERVAVGTSIAARPPHRSVRAALPHTALALDAWRQTNARRSTRSCLSLRAAWRTRLNPRHTVSRLGVRPALGCAAFSLANGLPSTASASGWPRGLARVVRLLPRYYPVVRLLAGVRVGRAAFAFTHRSAVAADRRRRGLPVLVQKVSRRAWGLRPRRACRGLAMASPPVWPSASEHSVGAPDELFHGSIPSPPVPLSTLHPRCRHRRRMTRGQDGSLLLSCGALSSPTSCRFIPALSLVPFAQRTRSPQPCVTG